MVGKKNDGLKGCRLIGRKVGEENYGLKGCILFGNNGRRGK